MEPNDANETERPLEHDPPSRPAGNPETDGHKKVSPGARALARWLGLGFIVIGGGIAGFYVPRLLWLSPASRYGSEPSGTGEPPAAEKAATVEADSPRRGDRQHALRPSTSEPAAAADGLPDPDSPLPATPSALLAEAARVADQLVKSFPDDPDSLEVRARFEDWRGHSEEAADCWERCLDLNPKYGHAYYGLSTLAAKKAEYEKAADLLRKALALEPDWPQAQIELAKALLNLDRPDEAIAVLKKHVGTSPLPAEGYYWLGQAQAQRGAYDEARESYERAVQLLPRYTDAYHGLAAVYTRLEEKEKARQCAEKFRELKAQDFKVRKTDKVQYDDLGAMAEDVARVYTNAGRIYRARGRLRETEKLWRRAAALAPKELEHRQSLAWLYRTSGRLAQTIRVLGQLGEMDPKNLSYPLEIGRLHARLQQFEAAERSFRAVSERWPEHYAGYAALAELYLQTNRHLPEAVPLAQKAVRLNETARGYALLSTACRKNGDTHGAAAAIKRAVALDPHNVTYRQAYDLLQKEP